MKTTNIEILKSLTVKGKGVVEGDTARRRTRTRQKRVSLWEEDHGRVWAQMDSKTRCLVTGVWMRSGFS